MLANKGMGECGEGHFRQEGSASTEICRDKISSAQLSGRFSSEMLYVELGTSLHKNLGCKLLEGRMMLRLESLQYLKGLAEPFKEP